MHQPARLQSRPARIRKREPTEPCGPMTVVCGMALGADRRLRALSRVGRNDRYSQPVVKVRSGPEAVRDTHFFPSR
jgi:hypothetical protein